MALSNPEFCSVWEITFKQFFAKPARAFRPTSFQCEMNGISTAAGIVLTHPETGVTLPMYCINADSAINMTIEDCLSFLGQNPQLLKSVRSDYRIKAGGRIYYYAVQLADQKSIYVTVCEVLPFLRYISLLYPRPEPIVEQLIEVMQLVNDEWLILKKLIDKKPLD